MSDAETESGNEDVNDNDKNIASDKEEIEKEYDEDTKNKNYTKEEILLLRHMVRKENLGCKNQCLFLIRNINPRKKNTITNFVCG